MYKRLLVVSNNCFSLENSNGRTLAGFVKGWPAESIAQFYTYNQLPNATVCNNYFRVTDKQALFSIWKGSVAGKINLNKTEEVNSTSQKRMSKYRNPLVLLLRNFVWNLGFWKGKHFNNWVNEFNPEIIFVQAGDTAYRLKIATNLAKKRNIPLIVYNSEGYYFELRNYLKNAKITKLLYPIFINKFRKQLNDTINYASHTIYSCEPLKKDFDLLFNKPSSVIYTASDVTSMSYHIRGNKKIKISYLGNLGLGRHETLIELANLIQSIEPGLAIEVYGKCPSNDIQNQLNDCIAISYKGFISYDNVKKVISESDILLHVENFSHLYIGYTKYGFSTKIADSLMSGNCFFLYAPDAVACSQYMLQFNPDCIATSRNDLIQKMTKLIQNNEHRISCSHVCLEMAWQNHKTEVASQRFLGIVDSIVNHF